MKKFLSIFLILIMILGVLVGCTDKVDESDTENSDMQISDTEQTSEQTSAERTTDTESESTKAQTSTETESETEASTTKPEPVEEYTIVYALYSGSAVQEAVQDLQAALKNYSKRDVPIQKENYYDSLNPGMSGKKIIVGQVEKDETSMEIYNSLYTSAGYSIRFVNDSVYIIGGGSDATAAAVEYFISNYIKRYKNLVFEFLGKEIIFERNEAPGFETLTIAGNPLSNYVIVHDGTSIGALYADQLSVIINENTGIELPVKSPLQEATEYEILVGKTDRPESVAARGEYDRPHVYYDLKVVGNKLVCMAEGWHTLKAIMQDIDAHFDTRDAAATDLFGDILSGNVLQTMDEEGMLERAPDTELRVLNYNIYGATYNYKEYTYFANNTERGEVVGDLLLAYFPDVITTNELYYNSDVYKAVMKHLGEYYDLVESEYDEGFPFENSTSGGRKNPEQIFIKKSCNFEIVDSGWRYLSEKGGTVTYHGIHWAVLKTPEGKQFIVSVGHYGESNSTDVYAREHQAAIAMAQEASGSADPLPVIASGDFFSHVETGRAYKHHTQDCGLIDPQRIEEINCNSVITQATCHEFGQTNIGGTRYDFVLHSDLFEPLKFKVLRSQELNYTSDHYPVCVDFKFK